MQWWLLEQYMKKSLPEMAHAISELVRLGYLETCTGPDGIIRYRASSARIAVLRQELEMRGHLNKQEGRGG